MSNANQFLGQAVEDTPTDVYCRARYSNGNWVKVAEVSKLEWAAFDADDVEVVAWTELTPIATYLFDDLKTQDDDEGWTLGGSFNVKFQASSAAVPTGNVKTQIPLRITLTGGSVIHGNCIIPSVTPIPGT